MRYFVAVAEELNFTRAAERLHIAQSPLSQQIRKLEREVGADLFVRSTRSVALTNAGEVFYAHVLGLLHREQEAVEAARKAAGGELGRLSVGFTGSATYELLPPLVRTYMERHPDVTLDLRSDMTTPVQVQALLERDISAGLLRPPVPADGLVVETLRHEPVIVLMAHQHPASAIREVNLADMRDEWFIAYRSSPPSTMYRLMESACHAEGFVPRVRQVVTDSAALVTLVAAGLGIALVPASLRHLGIRNATWRPLSRPRLTVSLALAYRDEPVDPLLRRFLETARAVVRSRDSVEATPTDT